MGNIHVKLYEMRTSGAMLFKERVYGQTDDRWTTDIDRSQ